MTVAAPIKPTSAVRTRSGPFLRLRLSNGYSWSHEFEAKSADTLATGCAVSWAKFVERIPEYQTRNRADCKRHALELHVCSPTGMWVNSNYGTGNAHPLFVGYGPIADCEAVWLRCLRAWNAAFELERFCSRIPKFLDESDV